jgi:peptide/nickel transport system permease protein
MTWLVRRIGRALLTLLLLIAFTFFTLAATGDPAQARFGPDVDPSALEAFRRKWGLDYPLWKQFLIYLDGLTRLEFGLSYRTGRPAWDLVTDRLPATLSLMAPTAFFALAFGVPLGIFAARNRGRAADRLTIVSATIALAVPNFLVGLLMMVVFSVWLGWLPPSGIVNWTSYLMPVATMSTAAGAIFARFTRSAMVEIMAHPMMETARASGLGPALIQRAHALPNVLLPLITVVALEFGNLVTYAVVTESVFAWPGVGRLLIVSVGGRDYAVVQAIILMTGTTMILANLLADILYGVIDPASATCAARRRFRRDETPRLAPERNASESAAVPPLIALSMLAVVVLLFCALFAQWLAPYDIGRVDLRARLEPPVFMGGDWAHVLGTDSLGRDMLSLLLRGIQVSMTIAAIGTVGGAVLGTTLGFLAAWIGGWVDDLIGILIDFQATLPNLILALALLAVLPQANFTVFVLIMVVYGWERYARLARAIGLSAKAQPWVQAQQVLGASPLRIVTRSILPNFLAVLLVNMSVNFPQTILVETTLNFSASASSRRMSRSAC